MTHGHTHKLGLVGILLFLVSSYLVVELKYVAFGDRAHPFWLSLCSGGDDSCQNCQHDKSLGLLFCPDCKYHRNEPIGCEGCCMNRVSSCMEFKGE